MKRLISGVAVGLLLAGSFASLRRRLQPTAQSASRHEMRSLLTEGLRTGPSARLVFHAIGHVYDLGLGRLVGHRFLRVIHRGRKSGRQYRTVLEVINYDPSSDESVVLSGWGGRADWYRNIRASPPLEVSTAGVRYTPVYRFVEGQELYAFLLGYIARNQLVAGVVRRLLGLRLDGSDSDRAELERRGYRGVAFRPAGEHKAQDTSERVPEALVS
jgi:deazaflavin-dependent oxidoreductase (nitroreductase family)